MTDGNKIGHNKEKMKIKKKLKRKTGRIQLENGRSMSTPSVNPSNWKSGGVKLLEKNWRITYYYHEANGNNKMIAIKGMNSYQTLAERRAVTQLIIDDEVEACKQGYNPITKKYERDNLDEELHPHLKFIDAFRIARSKIRASEGHLKEMGYAIDRLETQVSKLRLHEITIEQLTRRQLKQLLDSCDLPDAYFNKYLTFLSRLFGELVEYECCETNLIRDIRKRKLTKTQREILAPDEFTIVMNYLEYNYYDFWRYARIFLFSGARSTELLRVQAKDVDIEKQEYTTIIKKGSNPQETIKVILKEVIPLWEELLKNAKPNDYIFSKGLEPGVKQIKAYQITKRWYRLVKQSDKILDNDGVILKVTADFYSLKHSFLDSLPEDIAMRMASHTNSKTTALYRVNSEKRNREELKELVVEGFDSNL